MKLIWIRHGKTLENERGCYIGHDDPALSEAGHAQAQKLIERLSSRVPDIRAVCTSDLKRAVDTALPFCRHYGLPLYRDRALRELNFGKWEGKTYHQLMESDRDRLTRWLDNPFGHAPPGGETLIQLGERVNRWLDRRIKGMNQGDNLVIVSHGGPIRWFLSHWTRGDSRLFWQVEAVAHGEGLIAEWDGNWWHTTPLIS
ncbi:MAG: histidine phosphatase family protein [Bacillaceae bacterium]|nr:histidine phosphatase family protein [Bacillaceae bacterium]